MTQEQFRNQKWGVAMECTYKDKTRDIISVDFEEDLIGLTTDWSDQIQWVRCENVELNPSSQK